MSKASRKTETGARDRAEHLQRWIGVLVTVLVHLLLVLLVMLSPPITMTAPQGAAGGSSLEVTYIDLAPPPPRHAPSPHKPAPRAPAKASPKASRIRSTLVVQANEPVPPDHPATAATEPEQPPSEPTSAPPDAPDENAEQPARVWGQPPGMLPDDPASANRGLARSSAVNSGRSNDASSAGPSMEVGGYQVYYDLISENRLRTWRDQGMTELFLPLPGTRRLMVCPLEVALRRGSGECRMVEPDAPELKAIGDARDGINMQQVYKQGEVVWRGPGPYR
jgi:hypothetical protein